MSKVIMRFYPAMAITEDDAAFFAMADKHVLSRIVDAVEREIGHHAMMRLMDTYTFMTPHKVTLLTPVDKISSPCVIDEKNLNLFLNAALEASPAILRKTQERITLIPLKVFR